jgi:hypothetical protein
MYGTFTHVDTETHRLLCRIYIHRVKNYKRTNTLLRFVSKYAESFGNAFIFTYDDVSMWVKGFLQNDKIYEYLLPRPLQSLYINPT